MENLEIEETDSIRSGQNETFGDRTRRSTRNSLWKTNDETKLRGIKGRTIQRPKKYDISNVDFDNLDLRKLKSIYGKQELKTVKITKLETIVEDPAEVDDECLEPSVIFGKSKLPRRICARDPLNVAKALKDKRKKRAMELRGGRKGFKKISKERFMEIFNSMLKAE